MPTTPEEIEKGYHAPEEPPAPDMAKYFADREQAAADAAQAVLEGREPAKQYIMSQIKEELEGIMGSGSAADDIRRQCEDAIIESRCPAEGFAAYHERTGHPVHIGEFERTKKATEKYFQQMEGIMLRYLQLNRALEKAIDDLPREQRGAFGMLWATANLALKNIQTAHRVEDLHKVDYSLRLGRICYAISEGERKIIRALKDLGLDLPKEK